MRDSHIGTEKIFGNFGIVPTMGFRVCRRNLWYCIMNSIFTQDELITLRGVLDMYMCQLEGTESMMNHCIIIKGKIKVLQGVKGEYA